ncbi:MAG TPA: alpha-L-glutamate ligase [Thermoanaerobaculia bacterium]|nr:alpha-L-glutamate ligase [Thermoanaerobaculia bacterium]
MIVVVSAKRDLHAVEVMEHLQRRGAPATLLDLSEYPRQLALTMEWPGAQFHVGDVDLSECRSVWWRRPQPFALHDDLREQTDRHFAYGEIEAAFSGLWSSLDVRWVNHPMRDDEASRKVYQLKVAEELGFRIPRTCITSDPRIARAFVDEQTPERTIYKAFAGTDAAWRETRLLKREETEMLESVRFAPVIFQEYIRGTDLRITVVGDEIFPAAIHVAPSGYQVDFRMTMDQARIEAVTLPDALLEQLRAYMRRLGLVYGAIDVRLTPEGEYVFFEINPSGQWLFVEQATSQPITAALAGVLAS